MSSWEVLCCDPTAVAGFGERTVLKEEVRCPAAGFERVPLPLVPKDPAQIMSSDVGGSCLDFVGTGNGLSKVSGTQGCLQL